MTDDLPTDVRVVLTQLFAEGRAALEAGDRTTAVETVTTAETVATNKLPEGALRSRLLHGCERVRRLLKPDASTPDDAVGAGRDEGDRADDDHAGRDEGDRADDDHAGRDEGDHLEAAAAYLAAMEERIGEA